ncbi:MAG: carbamoyl phosphate synthase small subunit, partial [Clostridia bacterium]|nr:carbamoyl phosphate synthase small subunit [Clostridia bacterium]
MEGLVYLEDGTLYRGKGFGDTGTVVGELVFNTSMTGYQEILTDPSYTGQIINMTYPLIGNYGINDEESESEKIHAKGLIVKTISQCPSNYKSKTNIDKWLKSMKIPGIFNVDTRSITRKVRNEGTMKCVMSNENLTLDAIKVLCESTDLKQDYMKSTGIQEAVHYEGSGFRVAVLDYGIK